MENGLSNDVGVEFFLLLVCSRTSASYISWGSLYSTWGRIIWALKTCQTLFRNLRKMNSFKALLYLSLLMEALLMLKIAVLVVAPCLPPPLQKRKEISQEIQVLPCFISCLITHRIRFKIKQFHRIEYDCMYYIYIAW